MTESEEIIKNMDSIEVAKNINECYDMSIRCGNIPSLNKITSDDNLVVYIPNEKDWDAVQEHAFNVGMIWQGTNGIVKCNHWSHYKENTCIIMRKKHMSYGTLHGHSKTIISHEDFSPELFIELIY